MLYDSTHLEPLAAAVMKLRDQTLQLEQAYDTEIKKVVPDYQNSARNLLHYLALRQHDLRELQHELTVAGVSSLGRSEAYVLASLTAVIEILHRAQGTTAAIANTPLPPVDFTTGAALLEHHTEWLCCRNGHGDELPVFLRCEAQEDQSTLSSPQLARV